MAHEPRENLSRELCARAAALQFSDLPPEVVDRLKLFLMDTLGVVRGATSAPGIGALNRRLERWEPSGVATILLSGRKVSPPSAALANGAAAHALDFDDQHDPARVHTNCVMVPALLAAGQDAGPVDGKAFLLSLAIGAELHARLGLACSNSLGWGWHPTMVLGCLAGAIAVGRLLGLSEGGIQNALGMAYHQASGSAQSMRDGVLSKRLGAGFAARAAVLGAFLAADGLTGTRRSLEGSAGLISLYERDVFDVEQLLGGLGTDWRILDYSLKPYPCCRATHTIIGLGLQARARGIRADDVRSIRLGLGEYNWIAVGAPYEPRRKEVVHAQFNAAYTFARALRDGKVDFESFALSALDEPGIAKITSVTECINDSRISPPSIHPAYARITMRDGAEEELYSDRMKGSPDDPMTVEEVTAKFHACVRNGLPAASEGGDALVETIRGLAGQADAAQVLVDAFPT